MRGLGSDIVEIARIKGVLERHPDSFLNKTFTKNEQDYCLSHRDPAPRLAARFAAKEAVAKALGLGFGESLGFLDIEILNDQLGRPLVHLSPQASHALGHPSFLLTLSHEKHYALAVAILL